MRRPLSAALALLPRFQARPVGAGESAGAVGLAGVRRRHHGRRNPRRGRSSAARSVRAIRGHPEGGRHPRRQPGMRGRHRRQGRGGKPYTFRADRRAAGASSSGISTPSPGQQPHRRFRPAGLRREARPARKRPASAISAAAHDLAARAHAADHGTQGPAHRLARLRRILPAHSRPMPTSPAWPGARTNRCGATSNWRARSTTPTW